MDDEYDKYKDKSKNKNDTSIIKKKKKKKKLKEKNKEDIIESTSDNLTDIQRVMKRNRELYAENEALKKKINELMN